MLRSKHSSRHYGNMVEVNRPSTALFDVFLRLRPSSAVTERFLDVERSGNDDNGQGQEATPTHITIKPPSSDHRKRAIERFAFTRVFEEHVGQREVLESTGALALLEGVLGPTGREGRDGLLATLGVTGSGKVSDEIQVQEMKWPSRAHQGDVVG